ncbi:zinc ribbon domain-containing protein [Planococcus sp. CAU13]|uniref:zinc ribbon domain-containing protein n=1 Tax=Planococcus sp. CAU13 TaxID=1541197 RepID=UPI00052FF5F5|nr:zinc ribbon domain-containing protein [Planococcus sp. CAU13]
MKCLNCGHEQSAGKFCGKCGGALQSNTLNQENENLRDASVSKASEMIHQQTFIDSSGAALTGMPIEKGQSLEKAKEASKLYGNYFFTFIRKPSAIFDNTAQNLPNALISVALFFIITAIIIHNSVGYLARLLAGFSPQNMFFSSGPTEILVPSIVDVFPSVFMFLTVLFALSFGSIVVSTKLPNSMPDIKKLVTVIGTLLIPAILILAASYLLLLIGARSLGNSLFLIGLVISFLVIPLYAVNKFVEKHSGKFDSMYASIAYSSLFLIGSSICFSLFVKAKINEALSTVKDVLSFLL